MASEGTGGVIVRIAIRIWAVLLENRSGVYRPAVWITALCIEGPAATVLVGIEGQTGGLACHRVTSCISYRQLTRTVAVHVLTTSTTRMATIKVIVRMFAIGAIDWEDVHWQVVTVHQRNIVVILASIAVHGKLGQRHRWHAASSVAFDFVSCEMRKFFR